MESPLHAFNVAVTYLSMIINILNCSALSIAAMKGYENITRFLVENGADVEVEDNTGMNALHQVSKLSTEFSPRNLMDSRANNREELTSPCMVVSKRIADIAQILIDKSDININKKSKEEMTALHYAVSAGNLYTVQLLLERGANPDVSLKSLQGGSSLYWLFCHNHIPEMNYDICKLLLEKGANCYSNQNSFASSAFFIALEQESLRIVTLFFNHGADILAVNSEGWTTLHFAARNPHVEVLEFILDQGFDVNSKTNDSVSALHFAVICGNLKGCELLLKRGAIINAQDKWSCTPLRKALDYSRDQCAEILLEHGAYVVNNDLYCTDVLSIAITRSLKLKNVLISYMAKMVYLSSSINEEDREMIEKNVFYRKYYKKCLFELESMKKVKFYNDVSIFDIFTESEKVIAGYARNYELVNAFEREDYEKKFPIYFNAVMKKFGPEVQKQKSRNNATELLCELFKYHIPLDYLVVRKILDYLNDEDLMFLVS